MTAACSDGRRGALNPVFYLLFQVVKQVDWRRARRSEFLGKIPNFPKNFSTLRALFCALLAPLSALTRILPLSPGLVQPNRATVVVRQGNKTRSISNHKRNFRMKTNVRRFSAPRSKQEGISLITVVLGLAIAGAVTIGAFGVFNSLMRSIDVQSATQEVTQGLSGVARYYMANRSFEGFDMARHSTIQWEGVARQNIIGGLFCEDDAAVTVCPGTAAAVTNAGAAAMTLVYQGFDTEQMCQEVLDQVGAMPHVIAPAAAATRCVARGTTAFDLALHLARQR